MLAAKLVVSDHSSRNAIPTAIIRGETPPL